MDAVSSGKPPEGWDEVDPNLVVMARMQRQMYLAYLMSGFTTDEAQGLIARIWASVASGETSAPEGS